MRASTTTGEAGLAHLGLGALVGAAALAASARRRETGPDSGRGAAPLACLALLAAGLGLGLREGARAGRSCTAALKSGDGVVVEGFLATALRSAPRPGTGGGPADRWARLSLFEARIVNAGRACALPRLSVRVLRPEGGLPAGSPVRAAGEWRRYGPADRSSPRDVGHYGAVYGTLVPGGAGAGEAAGGRVRREGESRGRGRSPADAVGPLSRALLEIRARASRRLERLLPEDAVSTAQALVLADRSGLSPSVTRAFVDAGLSHLLAISGLHVGLLAAGALWLSGLALRGRGRWTAAAIATGGYVVAIGAPPAAMRAAILFAGFSVARARGSPARLGDLLGWAASASLVGAPLLLHHPGFQMSFAGFVGLLAGDRVGARAVMRMPNGRTGTAARRLGGWTATLLRPLAASAGAFLLTAPLAAAHFGRVAPASVVSSLLGAPLVALALAGLLPALMLPGPPAGLLAAGAAVPLRALIRLADWFAGLPLHGPAAPPDAVAWSAIGLAGAGLGAVFARTRRMRARGVLALAAAAALWTSAPGLRARAGSGATLLCTLDVGQGDAAVLRTRRGHWVVFDAGPGPGFPGPGAGTARRGAYDAGARTLVPFLRRRGARAVELFVLSHPHLDHLGGAAALFDAFPVRRVLDAGTPVPASAYLRYLAGVGDEGARWLPARAGGRLRLDEVEILVLGPAGPVARGPAGAEGALGPGAPAGRAAGHGRRPHGPALDPNDVSVAVRVRIDGAFVYVNTGDAPAAMEAEILERWPPDSLRADLLKLGHHGSRTSTSGAWLAATRPELAVVSVGSRNRYGHPHPSTLARIDSARVPVLWRTDRRGTLCVEVGRGGGWTTPGRGLDDGGRG